jgi:hypothetical protein
MHRLYLFAALAAQASACAEVECTGEGAATVCLDDDRPKTLEYVTETILRPSCGVAQCHSSYAYAYELRLDTVEHAQESIARFSMVAPGDPDSSQLYLVLIRETADDGRFPRMPYDAPLPGPDIALIRDWIDSGADGYVEVTP